MEEGARDAVELQVREAVLADYDALCRLFDEGDALHRANLPHIFRRPAGAVREEEYIRGLLADEGTGLFVAESGGQLVGVVCIVTREAPPVPLFVPRRYAVLDNLVVQEAFRRRGIGRALLERAHAWALEKGLDDVELNVWEFNQGAIAFYGRLGYESTSRRMSKRLR